MFVSLNLFEEKQAVEPFQTVDFYMWEVLRVDFHL